MRKFIGTIAIIFVLYLGFFGSKRFNVEPFITNWLQSDSGKQVKDKVERKVKEETDSIKEHSKDKLVELITKSN